MRAHVRVNEKWEIIELPANPKELMNWLVKHDGQEVVVADDENKVYYTAREKELELYRKKGKKAEMFYHLAKVILWPQIEQMEAAFDRVNEVFPDSKMESASLF